MPWGRISEGQGQSNQGEDTYVTAGEVTALEHEGGNDAVEAAVLVAEALLSGAELTEVLGRLGDNVIVEYEIDPAFLACIAREQSQRNAAGSGPPKAAIHARERGEEATTAGSGGGSSSREAPRSWRKMQFDGTRH